MSHWPKIPHRYGCIAIFDLNRKLLPCRKRKKDRRFRYCENMWWDWPKTALATSEASARVHRGFFTIDSNIWVAQITGFPTIKMKKKIIWLMPGSLYILVTLFLVFSSFWLNDFLYLKFPFCLACLAQ